MEELVEKVQSHLDTLNTDHSTPLDTRLVEDLKRRSELDSISTKDQLKIIGLVASVIGQLLQDVTPLADLVKALLDQQNAPSFAQIVSLEPEVDLVAGLKTRHTPINQLSLHLLRAASRKVADVGLVAGKPDIALALVDLWLTTSNTAIATQAETTLIELLGTERPVEDDGDSGSIESLPQHEPVLLAPMGLMWRRIFKDKDIYRSIFAHCSLKTVGQPGQMSKANKTNAQARLFSLLKSLLYAPQIWESQIASIEKEFDVPTDAGILDFALCKMVDWKDDVIMHSILMQFYQDFISYVGPQAGLSSQVVPPASSKHSYTSLERMISLKLHDWTMSYYLKPDPDDPLKDFLYSPAASYIGEYARHHTEHFRSHVAKDVLRKLSDIIGNLRPSEWANNRLPMADLTLLPTIPRRVLLDLDPSGGIVSHIALKPVNFQASTILEGIFSHTLPSPPAAAMVEDDAAAETSAERMAARALFSLYLNQHPTFWRDVTAAADVRQGNFPGAHATLSLLKRLVESRWERLPDGPAVSADGPFRGFPRESQLGERCSGLAAALPVSGAVLLITEPAIGVVLPWLVEPPPRLPPSVAPASGARDEGWVLARLKHQVLVALRQRLAEIGQRAASAGAAGTAARSGSGEDGPRGEAMQLDHQPDAEEPPQAWRDVLELLERRERMGPWGDRGTQSVRVPEPEVATMEL